MCDDEDHYMMKKYYPYFVCATFTCSSPSRSRGPIDDTGTGAYELFPAAELSIHQIKQPPHIEVADADSPGRAKKQSFWGALASHPACTTRARLA